MKVYLLKEEDFTELLTLIDRDPQYGTQGGSSAVLSDADRRVYKEAHRFYNYQIHRWLTKVKSE